MFVFNFIPRKGSLGEWKEKLCTMQELLLVLKLNYI